MICAVLFDIKRNRYTFTNMYNKYKRAPRMIVNKMYEKPSKVVFNELKWVHSLLRCEFKQFH